MTTALCCFMASMFLLTYLSVYSQPKGHAVLNLFHSTHPVLTTLSQKNFLFKHHFVDSKPPVYVRDACGLGAQGGEVTNANGNANVSPNSKVYNSANAVDGDVSTYSTLYIDVQQKDVEVIQNITFGATTNATDYVKLTLSLGAALTNYKVTAQAYNGNTAVGTIQTLTNSLTILPATVDYVFQPGVIFDQVRIGVIALQNGNHIASINLHEIYVTPAPPAPQGGTSVTQTSSNVTACEGGITLSMSNAASGLEYRWYNSSNTYIQTSTTYSPNLSAGNYTFYVSTVRTGCTIESARHQINLSVKPKPATPAISLN
jgi:large repetitive protein